MLFLKEQSQYKWNKISTVTFQFSFYWWHVVVVVVMKLNINTATTYNIFVKTENWPRDTVTSLTCWHSAALYAGHFLPEHGAVVGDAKSPPSFLQSCLLLKLGRGGQPWRRRDKGDLTSHPSGTQSLINNEITEIRILYKFLREMGSTWRGSSTLTMFAPSPWS